MKYYFLFCVLLPFMFLTSSCNPLKKDYPEIAHAITLKTAKELEKEKGMELVGTGGGMIGQVNSLGMHLNYYSPLEISEARNLALLIVDKFLSNINKDEKVRPYLNSYPFKAEDLRIFITFRRTNGLSVQAGKLHHIVIGRGMLTYNTRSTSTGRFSEMFEESISDARERVRLGKLED